MEGPDPRGLTVETLCGLADAFGVPASSLLDEEEPATRAGSGPGPPEAEHELLGAFRLLTERKQWKLVQDLQRRAREREQTPADALTVTLGEIATVARGAEVPAGCIQRFEMSAHEVLSDSDAPNFRRELLKRFKLAARSAGGEWARSADQGALEARPAFCFEDLRAIAPLLPSSAMLYGEGMPKIYKDDLLVAPGAKVVIEPRSLLAAVDQDHALVPQTMVVAVPREQPDVDQAIIGFRIAATLSLMPPERLGPGGNWLQKSYRPRVTEIRSLRLPSSITGTSGAWRQVDKHIEVACKNAPLADREPPARRSKEGLDHCEEERKIARRVHAALVRAVEYAFDQAGETRPRPPG